LSFAANSVAFAWPAWALTTATNLVAPVQWLTVTNPPGSNNGQFSVMLPFAVAARFFWLKSP